MSKVERTVVVTEVTGIVAEAEAVLMTGMKAAQMVKMVAVRSAREVRELERTLAPTHSPRGASCRGRVATIA